MENDMSKFESSLKASNEKKSVSPPIPIKPNEEIVDSSDNSDEDDYEIDHNSDGNLDVLSVDDPLCFSPPQNARELKKIGKRRKSKSFHKGGKLLVNSAEYLNKESADEASSITDSLITSVNNVLTSSTSAPPTSTITCDSSRPFADLDRSDLFCSESRLATLSDINPIKSMIVF